MPPACEELLLTSFADALSRLAGATIAIDVLAPAYPCAGRGALRVVRAERVDLRSTEQRPAVAHYSVAEQRPAVARYRVVVTYDDYVRL